MAGPTETDVCIVGAGPVGLFQVFECGMLRMRCVVVDALDAIGGQCIALYPEKPIYDIPAHPAISAAGLIEALIAQAAPFRPDYRLGRQVVRLAHEPDGRLRVGTSAGDEILAKAVVIAAGAGAFGPNRPPIDGIDAYEGRSVFYAVQRREDFRGKRVVMHVRDCSPQRIRIPLVVDQDRSRTWVLTRRGDRIELKHDHRHEDGRPEAMTMYGGTSTNAGSADTQMFPADDQTRDAIPGSGLRSAWLIEVHPGERFVYAANRVGTERGFQVDFDLTRPVQAPPAPWGWED